MRHAGPEALTQLASLLGALRTLPGLVERQPGIFYRRGAAFLHFHEDAAGLFADLKQPPARGFQRWPVSDAAQQAAFLAEVAQVLAGLSSACR